MVGVGTVREDARRSLWRSRWAAFGAAVAVTVGGGGIFVAQAASSPESSVVTIDPVRILDTRTDVGLPGPFVSSISQKLKVTGAAVPTGATGVLLNVTVVNPTANGFLSVRPGDATGAPSTSSLNFTAGDIVPNSVQVGLPTVGSNAGQIDITYDAFGQAGPTTEVLIDVVGYTSNAKFDALQAEIDAIEAVNGAQQTQIDAKVNTADVYTKAQIDASAASSVRAAGAVQSNGSSQCGLFACVGTWSSTQTATGVYTVIVPDATPGSTCRIPLVQLTTGGINTTANLAFQGLNCQTNEYSFIVNTYDTLGVQANVRFQFSIQVQPTSLVTPALANSPQYEMCTVDEAGNASCQ